MKRKLTKVFVLMLTVALLTTCFPAMAANDQTSSTVPLMVSTSDPVFSVSVPTTLPIHMDAAGNITCGDITITNNSSGPVLVEDTQITALNGWILADYATTTFTDANKGQHRAALQLNRSNGLTASGSDTNEDFIPAGGGRQTISAAAKIPYQGVDAVNTNIAQIVFVLGWHRVIAMEGLSITGGDSVDVGSTIQLSAAKIPTDTTDTETIFWSSSNTAVATVSNSGIVTGQSAGATVITASCNGVETTKNVRVYNPITDIQLLDSAGHPVRLTGLEIRVYEGQYIGTVYAFPESVIEGRSIKVTSSNENIMRVEGIHVYVGSSVGKGIITASCGSFSKTFEFEVGHWS